MNRLIGFSTGALAFGDFRKALAMLRHHAIPAVELSALRQSELDPLWSAAPELDLSGFQYVAVHAPSAIEPDSESQVVRRLLDFAGRGWPIVIHPDAIHEYSLWRTLGGMLCVENMDKRKPVARTVEELEAVFEKLPDSRFCLDLGHARQVDPTMTEAYRMARIFGSKIQHLHISEVNTRSKHERLSDATVFAFRRVADCLPPEAPLIIEAVINENQIQLELRRVCEAIPASVAAA